MILEKRPLQKQQLQVKVGSSKTEIVMPEQCLINL